MSRSRSRVSPATIFFALLSAVLAAVLYLQSRSHREEPAAAPAPSPSPPATARPRGHSVPRNTVWPSPRSSAGAVSSPSPAQPQPRIAILIDDLGNDPAAADRIARWPKTVSAAVLPALAGSFATAREFEKSGKQVLLHLPMEPRGYPAVAPGPGVLLISQSDEQIEQTLESDLDSVPGAVGVNNHMGSAATADPRLMRVVMRVLARRGLFFVDSRTTETTVGESQARAAGVASVSRRVFLDDVATPEGVEKSLAELVARGRAEGFAVGIGHPHAATLSVLERELPRLESEGVRLVRVGDLTK